MNPRALLLASFHVALAAADPRRLLPQHLPPPPRGRTLVVGGGKAAASMAAALEVHWPQTAPLSGLVVTRYRHALPPRPEREPPSRIEVVEASHPLPDGRGAAAAERMLGLCTELGTDDLLLALLSGGASSLLASPVEGVTLPDLRRVTRALLHSGASIQEINTVRKHLTRVSGGRLARAAGGAQVLALILSDVAGNDVTHIASGPCAPDPTCYADALDCLRRYAIDAPHSVMRHLLLGVEGGIDDTPKPGDACFARTENRVIGDAGLSLAAAARYFSAQGIHPIVLTDRATGDAHVLAKNHAALLHSLRGDAGRTGGAPLALISGGETTVQVRNANGRGGRNSEYLLALALALNGKPNVWALAADTDGIDGSADHAGAVLAPDSLSRAAALGLDARAALAQNDSYGWFAALGDLLVTGPTLTNVNDYRVLLIN